MRAVDDALSRALEFLEYPAGWRGSGLLPDDFFLLQRQHAEADEFFAPEHYRLSGFLEVLGQHVEFSDEQFRAYIALAEQELCTVLYATPLVDLARWRGLTPTQRAELVRLAPKWPASVARALGAMGRRSNVDSRPSERD